MIQLHGTSLEYVAVAFKQSLLLKKKLRYLKPPNTRPHSAQSEYIFALLQNCPIAALSMCPMLPLDPASGILFSEIQSSLRQLQHLISETFLYEEWEQVAGVHFPWTCLDMA